MSSVKETLTRVPQGSVLGPLLSLIFINDLYKSIRFSTTYHFADDTSNIQSKPSLERLSNWLRANKLNLNVKETELIIFRPRKLKTNYSFKFKFDGKRLVPTHSVKCLGVLMNTFSERNK